MLNYNYTVGEPEKVGAREDGECGGGGENARWNK